MRTFMPFMTLSCVSLLLSGCAGYPTYESGLHVQWADDVGTVTISQSGGVTDWDDIASELQPSFKMDSATAFANAIPTTQSLDERLYDALTANVQVGLPTSSFSNTTKEVTNPETGELETTVDNTRTRQSGTPPVAAGLSPTGAAALAALGSQTLGDDPMLRYLAATALQQEVALLNRYIKDQVSWPGSQAFVVRLQLTVIPNARTMPYDIETDITLHAEDEQSRARLALASQAPLVGGSVEVATALHGIKTRQDQCAKGSYDAIQLLPMIVTDNLEGLKAARSTDNVRQVALALLGTAGNVGASGQFARTMEELRRTEGHDTNSLLTVAKLSDDSVRVRLGAVQSPRYGRVMTPRNHFVSLVVLFRPCVAVNREAYVDDGPRTLTAVTRTTFRDGDTGKDLPYQNGTARLTAQIGHIQKRFVGQFNYLELARMYQWATRQDRKRFFDYVVGQHLQASMCKPGLLKSLFVGRAYKSKPADYDDFAELQDYVLPDNGEQTRHLTEATTPVPPGYENRDARCLALAQMRYEMVAAPLWTELQSLRPTGQFAFTNIPLTLRKRRPAVPPLQTALVNFSKSDASVVLVQGQDLSPFRNVRLTLDNGTESPIASNTTSISANGRAISGTFPPLGRFGIAATKDKETAPSEPAKAKAGKDKPAASKPSAPETPTYMLVLDLTAADGKCPSGATVLAPQDQGSLTGCRKSYPVRFFDTSASPPSSPFSLSASASGILSDPSSGSGKLNLVVVAPKTGMASPENLRLSVEGAQIANARLRTGAAMVFDGSGWKVPGVGEILLDLENLIPNTVVKVNLKDGSTSAGSINLSVVPGARKEGN